MLETCTSDTHFSHKLVRTRQGYHQFGLLTPKEVISEWYLQIAKTARDSVQPASFEVLEGSAQFHNGIKDIHTFAYPNSSGYAGFEIRSSRHDLAAFTISSESRSEISSPIAL